MKTEMKTNSIRTTEEEAGVTSSRRDFLKVAGTVAAGVVLPIAAASWATPAAAQSVELKGKNKMKTRNIGNLKVSEIGFGNMLCRPDAIDQTVDAQEKLDLIHASRKHKSRP